MIDKIRHINHKYRYALAIVLLIIVAATVISYWPSSRNAMKHSAVIIESRSYYTVDHNDSALFSFSNINKDSLLLGITTSPASVYPRCYSAGCWVNKYAIIPSCRGRILTCIDDEHAGKVTSIVTDSFIPIMRRQIKDTKIKLSSLRNKADDLKYYLSVHGVQDEGYDMISRYASRIYTDRDSINKIYKLLNSIDEKSNVRVSYHTDYTVIYRDAARQLKRIHCHALTSRSVDGFRLIQTDTKSTPSEANPQFFHHLLPWHDRRAQLIYAAGYDGLGKESFNIGKAKSTLMPGYLNESLGNKASHSIPKLFAPDGTPIFSDNGFFLGISKSGKVISTRKFHFLLSLSH